MPVASACRAFACTLACSVLLTVGGAAGAQEVSAALSWLVPLQAEPPVGGLSGIEVAEGGETFTAISDRGLLVTGTLSWTGDGPRGHLAAARALTRNPLERPQGVGEIDSEGLAIEADGTMHVSFEGDDGVWTYESDGSITRLDPPPGTEALHLNARYEALAVDAEGRLLTLPERSGGTDRAFPLWRLENGEWRKLREIRREGGWLPVGADIGPDGALYLLDRRTRFGFRARVRRFDLSQPEDPGSVVFESPGDGPDNFEGISVFERDGAPWLILVADNNLIPFLPTRLMSLPLAPAERND